MALPAMSPDETPFLMTDEIIKRPTLAPQPFRRPTIVRTPFGQVRFLLGDTVNVTQKPLSTTPLAAERVTIHNRAADDAGTATNGNTLLIAGSGGSLLGPAIAQGSSFELLNVDLSEVKLAYGGAANLAGAQIVLAGWVAHGLIRYAPRFVSAAIPGED